MFRKLILNVIGLLFMSVFCFAYENPNVSNSFRAQNAPTYSGQQQRFITRGNPYGRSGNDIVSGNVGGGKHFRGVVPYGSSYYSRTYTSTSGTGSVNDFIRRSQNPIVNDRNPGQVRTFVDPRRSVSSMTRPDGTSGLTNPQLAGQGRKTNPYTAPLPTQTPTLPYQRPLSTNNMTLEEILARREQLRQEREETEEKDEETTEKKGFFDDTLYPDLFEQKKTDEKKQDSEEINPEPVEDILTQTLKEDQEPDVLKTPESTTEETTKSEQKDDTQLLNRINPKSDYVPEIDINNLSAEGRKILGEHKTFASLANEKFDNYMDAAEEFIKNGQFYKAADTYALAILWKPEDARAYLGQSFSLFAAGEYMSSAYYLSRAFELNPKAATKKYNLSEFFDNRDVFDNRVVEITSWQQRSGSGELAFLLAYISYQDGKAVRAVDEIRKAKETMPEEPAVRMLKNIIDPEEILK